MFCKCEAATAELPATSQRKPKKKQAVKQCKDIRVLIFVQALHLRAAALSPPPRYFVMRTDFKDRIEKMQEAARSDHRPCFRNEELRPPNTSAISEGTRNAYQNIHGVHETSLNAGDGTELHKRYVR